MRHTFQKNCILNNFFFLISSIPKIKRKIHKNEIYASGVTTISMTSVLLMDMLVLDNIDFDSIYHIQKITHIHSLFHYLFRWISVLISSHLISFCPVFSLWEEIIYPLMNIFIQHPYSAWKLFVSLEEFTKFFADFKRSYFVIILSTTYVFFLFFFLIFFVKVSC